VKLLLLVVGFYLTCYVLYQYLLIGSRLLVKESLPRTAGQRTRFAILIPAHNEEALLAESLRSIDEQRYPKSLYQCVVIADNCTDNTAGVALGEGATVLERRDSTHRGKGHALKWGLTQMELRNYDAVLVLDADSRLGQHCVAELDAFMQSGENAIQCSNNVDNPDESWFSSLTDVSRSFVNEMCLAAKQRLGLSAYLMGNGMCFSTALLERYGWNAFTVGEDWEFYAYLVLQGERVGFCRTAKVFHRESTSLKQATSQRMRWSSGRFLVAAQFGSRLFIAGLIERSMLKLDASLPLLFPNLSLGVNLTLLGLVASALTSSHDPSRLALVSYFVMLILLQACMFLSGIIFTHNKKKRVAAVVLAPLFLMWKMGIDLCSIVGFGRAGWSTSHRKSL